eukprot:jgi/Chrzof1/11539/UNPLg00474.t1
MTPPARAPYEKRTIPGQYPKIRLIRQANGFVTPRPSGVIFIYLAGWMRPLQPRTHWKQRPQDAAEHDWRTSEQYPAEHWTEGWYLRQNQKLPETWIEVFQQLTQQPASSLKYPDGPTQPGQEFEVYATAHIQEREVLLPVYDAPWQRTAILAERHLQGPAPKRTKRTRNTV